MGAINDHQWELIFHLRLPRLIMAICNGLLLSMSGAITQALFKNPLAAPSLIGISSGASLSAAVAISVSHMISIPIVKSLSIPVAAFIGGAFTCTLVFRLSWLQGRSNIAILILAGVAINAVCGSLLGLILYLADDNILRSITFWTMGSIGAQNWSAVALNLASIGVAVTGAFFLAKALNAIAFGENIARHLGYSVERVKLLSIFLVAYSVGVSVSFCGLIGFVGLVVPHISRMIFGAEFRQTILGCLVLGPTLMLLADLVAKTVVYPAELPIGIVTSGIGGPFFIYLLVRLKRKGGTL